MPRGSDMGSCINMSCPLEPSVFAPDSEIWVFKVSKLSFGSRGCLQFCPGQFLISTGVKNHFWKSWPAEESILALSLEINNLRTSCTLGSDPNFGASLAGVSRAGRCGFTEASRGCTEPPDHYTNTFQI